MSAADPINVLFIGFWGVNDPLTTATILPGIRTLRACGRVGRVVLATIEREGAGGAQDLGLANVVHLPWRSNRSMPKVMARTMDHLGHVRQLVQVVRRERIGLIIARAAPAGSFGDTVSRITGLPLVVESFEPHADYMADCGEWERTGLMYRISRRIERKQIADAMALITVAHSYRDHLVAAGTDPSRVMVAPCPVDTIAFHRDPVQRERSRAMIGAGPSHIVGIYAGKFGGMYHDRTAFEVFASTEQHLRGRFKLVILTPEPVERVLGNLKQVGFPLEHAHVDRVPHDHVPRWLSASDLAFALYKRTPSSRFLSPVKIGEYWACGLPVLLTEGVADDSGIITTEGIGGAVFDPLSQGIAAGLDAMLTQIGTAGMHERIRELALRHRSIDRTADAYARVFELLDRRNT